MDVVGASGSRSAAAERDARGAGKRRRPSGEPPPLPRKLGVSGRVWLALALGLLTTLGVFLISTGLAAPVERWESAALRLVASVRTGLLTSLMLGINAVFASRWTIRILRIGTVAALIGFRRWRHLLAFVATVAAVDGVAYQLSILLARSRPTGVRIIAGWQGFAMPSRPVAALAVTLVGMVYRLLPAGRARSLGKWVAGAAVIVFGLARVYLSVEHPTDVVAAVILGAGIPVVAFRFFTPNEVFPVTYRRGRAAHLDVGGYRGTAIRTAVRDQLGLTVLEVKPMGLDGSGGSTPLRLEVTGEGEPKRHVFGKLYARSHVRADRWYKVVRTIRYGALEDEAPFQSVRRFVEYEDYTLLLLNHLGITTPAPFGFVEITPEREYMIVMEFFDGAVEIGEAEVDDEVIDGGLRLIRKLWDAGLAHRDIKPANLMVRDGKVLLIDVFFVQVRPSPWRQAVDLANMMLVLAARTDARRVYERALTYFSAEEIAEAFAASRSFATPGQLRAVLKALKRHGRDVERDLRSLAPSRTPVAIQRWTARRIGLTLGVLVIATIVVAVLVKNWGVIG